jgi:hypothetical protein
LPDARLVTVVVSRLRSRRSLLALLLGLSAGCGGRDDPTDAPSPERAPGPTPSAAPTTGTTGTPAASPTPTGERTLPPTEPPPALLVRNEARERLVVTVTVRPERLPQRSTTFPLDPGGDRTFETLEELGEPGTLTVRVESNGQTREYPLPAAPTLVVTLTESGIDIVRVVA